MADGDVSLKFKLLGEDAGASRAFDKVGKSSDHLSTRMVAVGTAIGHLAASGVMALGGMAAGAVKTGIQTAAAMQQAQLGFATLLGSEKAAGDYMKWLTGFAASTPFELKGLVESSRTLIGVGVSASDAKVMLQNFGDTASAIGIDQDAFQRVMLATSQAISAGKFQAGDLNQIMTNGIPVWTILSKAMHKSVPELRDLASHGKLLSKDVLPALQAEMHKDYGGAMAKQSQTLNGLWSTFQDTIHLGMGSVLQPLIPIMQKYLPGAMDTAGAAFKTAAAAVDRFVNGGGLQTMASVIKNDVVPSLKFIGDHKDVFLALAASATAGVVAYRAYTGVMAIFTAVTTAAAIAQKLYAVATREATVAQVGLDVAMDANPIGLIVGAIAALVIGLIALGVWLYNIASHSETFRNAVTASFEAVKSVVMAVVGVLVTAWNAVPGSLSVLVGWFQALPGRIMGGIAALPGLLLGLIKGMFEKMAFAVGYSLGMLFNLFFVWPGKVANALASLPGKVVHWITTTGVQSVVAFYNFHIMLIAKAYALTTAMISWVAALVPQVVAWFQRLPGMALAALRALPGQIKAVFSAAGTWLLQAGKDVVTGLINGIKNAVGAAIGAVKDLGGQLISGFKSAVGISSPAKKMIPLGREVINGVTEGLKQASPATYTFLENFAKRIAGMKVTAAMRTDVALTVADFGTGLKHVAAQLTTITEKVKDQKKAYDDLVKTRDDYAKQLSQGINGGGSIAGIGLAKDEVDSEGNVTKKADKVGDFIKSLQAKNDAITNFSKNVTQLQAEGLSQSVITQIQEAGLETGGALASALAAATPDAVRSINALSDQITAQSNQMGKKWSGDMYDAAVGAAKGILDGLQSQESHLMWAIRTIAQNMVNELKKTLGLGIGAVTGSAPNWSDATSVGSRIALPAPVQKVGGAGTTVIVNLHNGIVGDAQQVATHIGEVVRRVNARGGTVKLA